MKRKAPDRTPESVAGPLCEEVMEQAGDAMLVADSGYALLHLNKRATSLLGQPQAALRGHLLSDLHPTAAWMTVEGSLGQLEHRPHLLLEVPLLQHGRSPIMVEASISRIVDPPTGERYLLVVYRDIEERRRAEHERLDGEKRQREALVREVHHRIKNHLQGLTGLLDVHATRHPEVRHVFAEAMTQVNSIALVHGLQSTKGSEVLRLCEMATAICRANQNVWSSVVDISVDISVRQPLEVAADECVPVALVVNELIANAVKHAAGPRQSVTVEIRDADGDRGEIRIVNHGRLPSSFHLPAMRSLSTGLGLAQALLPSHGVRLTVEQLSGNRVESRLTLERPVLLPRSDGAHEPHE
ncbi:MAG: PAS domain S-box protein [Ectothiorhodospiraceae bacterium]|nr:PAS domain S-box protein [Ectothiorhodospiraceae bacterium]MCH8502995.1 PAS domain S-box protein [Ectothiorhodospiraceae bacterium]